MTDGMLFTDLVEEIKDFVGLLSSTEQAFGPSTVVLKHGRAFKPSVDRTPWLKRGKPRDCFNNATAYAAVRDDVLYAEGYAVGPELVMPVQHAWLVDLNGRVIDPTWIDVDNHAYFGIAFDRRFLVEQLAENGGQAGILVNLHLIRRFLRDRHDIEQVILDGSATMSASF
ncbi:hypothetical protein GGQ64_004817 [Rhizobium azooxidifex]|uniref:Uncharacterized protein n=1 Tax=Mycoplana azooxidifex TaxID=1636188 RepID=A0A7W6DGW1_9HYPH|nr:hypothetical protein [Mycoplana azooxidifex]MBB3979573.1 hypothetical protein [Mycoplana azooxidifex]